MPAATAEEAQAKPQDRQASRSQLGYIIMIAYGCLDGISRRQASIATDTPASELFAASVAAAQLLHVTGVTRFVSFGVLGHDRVPLWCDNEVTVLVSKDATPLKRLAYIARRVRLLQELVRLNIVELRNIPGKVNPADVLTKYLPRDDFERYMTYIYNCARERLRAIDQSRPRPIGTRSGGVSRLIRTLRNSVVCTAVLTLVTVLESR